MLPNTDVASFIDVQVENGLFKAIRKYPHVALGVTFIPDEMESYIITLKILQDVGQIGSARLHSLWIWIVRLILAFIVLGICVYVISRFY